MPFVSLAVIHTKLLLLDSPNVCIRGRLCFEQEKKFESIKCNHISVFSSSLSELTHLLEQCVVAGRNHWKTSQDYEW